MTIKKPQTLFWTGFAIVYSSITDSAIINIVHVALVAICELFPVIFNPKVTDHLQPALSPKILLDSGRVPY
jgi:hypothetical protein